MTAVLGIDCAWTVGEPSGVALISHRAGYWSALAAAPSYRQFITGTSQWRYERGEAPPVVELLSAAEKLAGEPIKLVACDIPLSKEPIIGRRAADRKVSQRYGGYGCAAHSPSLERPGVISVSIKNAFEELGYRLMAEEGEFSRALIEVYPHPSLLALCGRNYRLPYKVSKRGKYWPRVSPAERREKLFTEWEAIRSGLGKHISGVEAVLPKPDATISWQNLKAFEDGLDALVCSWTGAQMLGGKAIPLGDEQSAIWIPFPADR